MNQEIILNCVPPCSVDSPSPAMSVLKAYLQNSNYKVNVIYWNLILFDLENQFLWDKRKVAFGESDTTLLYAAYLAVKKNDQELYKEVKAELQSIVPIMLNESNFYDKHITEFVNKLDKAIDKLLNSIDYNNVLYFGFSMKLDQWTLSLILAEKIKHRDPQKTIVVGGINTPDVAKCLLENFRDFDIATYGEGEIPLTLISNCLKNKESFVNKSIPRTFFREKDAICKCLDERTDSYSNLSEKKNAPVYTDYFEILKRVKLERKTVAIIEGSRGCHWNRCHFCYLNKGYLFRRKKIETLICEIRETISKHGILHFEFADNDAIGNDMQNFNRLLDELILLKKEYPDFSIIAFEIITQNVNKNLVDKMKEAGVLNIQIGYESSCDSLLKKIEKKNSFSSNLNVIKHCHANGITVSGINVIRNLLEETTDDIYESIENLRFYRFFLDKARQYMQTPNTLMINSSSKYFKQISEKKNEYTHEVRLFQQYYEKSMTEESKWHIFEGNKPYYAKQWKIFNDIQFHYLNNNYSYTIQNEKDQLTYIENYNGNELESFLMNDVQISICKFCYDIPVCLEQLLNSISLSNQTITEEQLRSNIDFLYEKGIVYHSSNYEEIVSIINI